MLKGFKQNRQSGKPSGTRSTKGPLADKKKGGSQKPPDRRRQPNATGKTLSWLFSQASALPPSQSHHADNNDRIFEISDDSESVHNLEAASGELRNDLPLSDPISEFPTSHEISKVGNGRATKNSFAEGKQVPTVARTIEITSVFSGWVIKTGAMLSMY